jgi:cytochrome c-type biogenesis protein CcmH/NrfF
MNVRRAQLHAILAVALAAPAALRAQPMQPQPPVRQPRTAAESLLEARTTRLASELRCPVCQGLSIQDSPSELAQQMRTLIKTKLDSGQTEEQVRAYFLERYGERILLAPKPTGFNLVAYLLPFIALAAGGALVFFAVRKWSGPPDPSHTHDMDGA